MIKTKTPSICVLDSGFVYVGLASIQEGELKIEKAQNVRKWGTTKGLGQLALEGPTEETTLDPSGVVLTPYPHKVNHIIPLSADATKAFNL